MNKFDLQEGQYEFPYHYLPGFHDVSTPFRSRGLRWGIEYLCYLSHAAEAAKALRPESVLEVGCGDGRFIGMLGPEVRRRVGIDLSDRAIRFARAFHPEVEFVCGDVSTVTERFDLVAVIEVLEHIADEAIDSFVDQIVRRVQSGGHVLISVPTDVVPTHPKHYRHYNASMVNALAQRGGMSVVSLEHLYDAAPWLERLLRWTCNRHITVDIALLNRIVWRYIWPRRSTAPGRGRHIVAALRVP